MLRITTRILVVVGALITGIMLAMAADTPREDLRTSAKSQFDDGQFRDAFELYRRLIDDADNAGQLLADDLQMAAQCLYRLQRTGEVDDLLADALRTHPDDWRVHWKAADLIYRTEHYGFIVAGEFERGSRRGGGQYVSTFERDRTQSLIWLNQARALIPEEVQQTLVAQFYREFAEILQLGREHTHAWRFQDLTEFEELPDYQPGYHGWQSGPTRGAPVDEQGDPILHTVPESFDSAKSDGQRWRWCLAQVLEYNPGRKGEVQYEFAMFLRQQFGVQTLQQWGIRLPRFEDDDAHDPQAAIWAMHTLQNDETIARLANGVKRFTLPEEFNFLGILRELADDDETGYAAIAVEQLAQIHADRQQYAQAAELWQESIRRFRDPNGNKKQRRDQIVGNWGQFESVQSQAAGTGATVEYRYRNGRRVQFTAREIKIPELIGDIKNYLNSNPTQLDWQEIQIDNVGYRLVHENERKYLGRTVANWSLDLDPRENHFDRRVTVTSPLQKAGAYLVEAKIAGGNVSRIILWIDDTAIVKKQLNGQALYHVADAATGQPVARANVEFFGWKNEQVPNTKRDYRVLVQNFAEFSDADGMIIPETRLLDQHYQWIAIARTPGGRFAHLGFSGVWYSRYYDQEYNQTKTYVVTDRPVYRPEQTVKFKFWMRETKFDKPDHSRFAHQQFTVKIHDPQGTEVYKESLTTDAYGGLAGEYTLLEEAKLGQYSLYIDNRHGVSGGGSFRVEEYKKPEFEVTIDAPDQPTRLGETVTATITAKYYYGAPVTNAKVSFKVERSTHDARWYPVSRWDWLYGNGYWWYSADYEWYPGFAFWGCRAPIPYWWNWNPDPPELVLDQEAEVGPDGTVQVEIDTALAKALHGDHDHEYKITAEVTDASRRTIVGQGNVLVSREPFKVFAWTDRGHYRVGDTVNASFQARTLAGTGVPGTGTLRLYKVTYQPDGDPVEQLAREWELNTNSDGQSKQVLTASEPGQYRLSYELTAAPANEEDAAQAPAVIEGGYLFVVRGQGFDGSEFRFNDLELIPEKKEYRPGETVELLVNTNRVGATVLLFVRPANGVYAGPPQVLRLSGKSTTVDVGVVQKDMPNFFVEALTISNGDVHTVVQEIAVPPEERILDVEIVTTADRYLPGETADVEVQLRDETGEPFVGSVVLSAYDRAVEYISGGSNVPEIREFFWKWKRSHHPQSEHNLDRWFSQLLRQGEIAMQNLGIFGGMVADFDNELREEDRRDFGAGGMRQRRGLAKSQALSGAMPSPAAAPQAEMMFADAVEEGAAAGDTGAGAADEMLAPTVRSNFADTAFWAADLTTDANGIAKVSFDMPENLSAWKLRAWGMGHGTNVGEGTSEVVTAKNIIVRLQAPRFFTEKDEVVLSAVVHNYLETDKQVRVELELEGETLDLLSAAETPLTTLVTIPAGGETRVDWRVNAIAPGTATVTMKALTDEESDAMQMSFPVFVHGFLKTESFSGVIRPQTSDGMIEFTIPAQRRPAQTRLEVRYSPTLAGAMVDALPYLVEYPYGCTEQTLNRFIPTVITQNILRRMGLDLEEIQEKRTNLNAQEIGDDQARAERWKQYDRNPVFDEAEVLRMVKQGVKDLTAMQNSDGGWGWFSGYGERSYPHTTAVVVHGLQLAEQNNVALVPEMIERGIAWLRKHQAEQVVLLQEGERRQSDPDAANRKRPYKTTCSNLDAIVFSVLVDSDQLDTEMQRFLYRDRLKLSLYSQSLLGLALDTIGADEQRDMIIRNIDQFLTVDNENQTAYLDLPNDGYWWYWYGNTIEANANYLRLLTRVKPQDAKTAGLVKYILNNRKHGTYWNSTRDTAYCIEALAEYLVASGEAEPNVQVEVWLDGTLRQTVEITSETLFDFDNSFVISGDDLTTGPHRLELRKKPLEQSAAATPLYFNAYLANFSLEDFITAAGLEIKVQRKFYKLVQDEQASATVAGARGQVIDQARLKYDRIELPNLSQVTSGDLIEIELEIDSKNDYEYLVFEDLKAAGCEPVDLQSGYIRSGLGAYVEFRDEKVAFFIRQLARGKHSVSYRLRAEVPGHFSALPVNAYAMYSPELKANSDEMKLQIADTKEPTPTPAD